MGAKTCAIAYRDKESIDQQLKVCEEGESSRNDPQYAAFIQSCDARAVRFDKRVNEISRTLAGCNAKTMNEAEQEFYRWARRAAAQGDTSAQICYLRGTFSIGRPWTEQEKAAYNSEARAYVKSAFERGDWRVVELLRSTTLNVVAQSGLMAAITKADRITFYRMNRLLRRGTDGAKYKQFLDALAEDPGAPLPTDTKNEADLWVAQTYDRYFGKSPRLDAQPDTCIAAGAGL